MLWIFLTNDSDTSKANFIEYLKDNEYEVSVSEGIEPSMWIRSGVILPYQPNDIVYFFSPKPWEKVKDSFPENSWKFVDKVALYKWMNKKAIKQMTGVSDYNELKEETDAIDNRQDIRTLVYQACQDIYNRANENNLTGDEYHYYISSILYNVALGLQKDYNDKLKNKSESL